MTIKSLVFAQKMGRTTFRATAELCQYLGTALDLSISKPYNVQKNSQCTKRVFQTHGCNLNGQTILGVKTSDTSEDYTNSS